MPEAKLIECVPNISAGWDRAAVDAVAAAVRAVSGVELLDVDPGAATNRTVFTFVGAPDACVEAAFQLIKTAASVIDMRAHAGEHARLGATDVCPFVPLQGATMADCVVAAKTLGERVAKELGIPVYLYEAAATSPQRKSLPDIRSGEYEGLESKLKDPAWRPDFMPAPLDWDIVKRSGATVIGARPFLIAYNVNLNSRDEKLAHDIALEIRTAGRAKRDAAGNIVKKADGTNEMIPGRLQAVKAVGWFIPEFSRAQISINLTDLAATPLHIAFETCVEEAAKRGLRVTGSEIVGLVPKAAMIQAGEYFLRKQGKSAGVPEAQLIECAALSLGLSDLAPFKPEDKVIEMQLEKKSAAAPTLRGMRIDEFADLLSSDSPAPGGGSCAALAGALGASLAAMVAALTHGKKGFEVKRDAMEALGRKAQALKAELLCDIDRDTDAFNAVMTAIRMPKKSEAEKAARDSALEAANREATHIPLTVLERSADTLELLAEVAEHGNPNSVSDAGVGALLALAAAEGAHDNVRINLKGMTPSPWADETRARAAAALERARQRCCTARAAVEKLLG
jgi:glutamate formiminotransferase/formiminotetrahydrofolate cyclodeaminase